MPLTENAAESSAVELDLSAAARARLEEAKLRSRRFGRWALPLGLFVASLFSTFLVGALKWEPTLYLSRIVELLEMGQFHGWFGYGLLHETRIAVLRNWQPGLYYAGLLMAFLMAHEMGHFVLAKYYKVPCSYPMVIPFPLTPIGTLGAVILTDPRKADRKMLFDIGIAGPITGLVIGIPILIYGAMTLDFGATSQSEMQLGLPWLAQWILHWVQPPGYVSQTSIGLDQLNPAFMAGWVGLLVTGLNMMPVSQLDGGHVIHGLFGKRAKELAWLFISVAIVASVWFGAYHWSVMIILVMFIGVAHPPTRDDRVPLGFVRTTLGWLSLTIPVICFTFFPLIPRT